MLLLGESVAGELHTMKNSNSVRLLVATFLTFLLTAPLLAQDSRQAGSGREQVTRVMNGRRVTVERPVLLKATKANLEQYRSDLLAILIAQKETAKMLHQDRATNELLDPILQQLSTVKFIGDAPPNYPGIPDLTGLKNAVVGLQQAAARALANGTGNTKNYVPTDPFPDSQYSTNLCPLNQPGSAQPAEVAFYAGAALLAAEIVKDLAQRGCEQTLLAFVYGGNFKLVCIVTDLVFAAARIAFYPIAFCDNDVLYGDLKGSNLRTEYIKDQLAFSINNDNTNKALLSTQMTNAENHIVANDNNNKVALSSQTASFQALTLRAAIERNLAADPANVGSVALFQLPASRGGYLEAVRQTLIDTYNAQKAAAGPGVVVYNPATELSLGATFTAQGKYREAYYYYRRGFRSVVKYP
jgi:hypothetical protein